MVVRRDSSATRIFNDDSDHDDASSSDSSEKQHRAHTSFSSSTLDGNENSQQKDNTPIVSSLMLYDKDPDSHNEPETAPFSRVDGEYFNAARGKVRRRVVFKGRKYDWKAKINMHIHIVEHYGADCFEMIAFNSSTFSEAMHIYVKASYIFDKVVDEGMEEKLEAIVSQFDKLKFPVPEDRVILEGLLNYKASSYLIDHMVVQTKPHFSIDIKEVDTNPNSKHSNRRASLAPRLLDDLGNKGAVSRINVPDALLSSITLKKSDNVLESEVKRYGKSATLVGEVVNAKAYRDDEVLYKIISTLSVSSLPSQATRVLSRISTLYGSANNAGRKSNSSVDFFALKAFAKLKNNNDLLQESLSFLHISDMLLMQTVCRRWKSVLSYAVKLTSSLYITSRDYYFSEDIASERNLNIQYRLKSSRGGSRSQLLTGATTPSSATNLINSASRSRSHMNFSSFGFDFGLSELRPPDRFKVREIYVLPDIALKVMHTCGRHLTELRLHYVIMSLEMIGYLACLSGRLKKLSLGLVKIDDQVRKHVEKKEAPPVPPKPQRPSISMPSTRTMFYRRHTAPVVTLPAVKETVEVKTEAPEEPPLIVSNLRLLNSADLKAILFSCGAELHTLELSVVMGVLRPDTFNFAPKLTNLIMHDTLIAPQLVSTHRDVQGSVNLTEFAFTMLAIPIAELLALISDAHDEAFVLTDSRGRIVVANNAWCAIFGYAVEQVVGNSLDFLIGPMTNIESYQRILNGLKSQLKAEECNVFLHHKNNMPLLCQVVMLPNLTKYRGAPLQPDCLSYDFLGQLALEQEDNMNKLKVKGRRGWKVVSKELSYHLLRFGVLSQIFNLYHTATA
ncbi:PAS domain-containing protein [archaeon]|nr:MAG: PAS domain-containing protein [archaeon]